MDADLSRIRKLVDTLPILTLSGMVLLTFIDAIGRRLFGAPLYGAHDATEHLMAGWKTSKETTLCETR